MNAIKWYALYMEFFLCFGMLNSGFDHFAYTHVMSLTGIAMKQYS